MAVFSFTLKKFNYNLLSAIKHQNVKLYNKNTRGIFESRIRIPSKWDEIRDKYASRSAFVTYIGWATGIGIVCYAGTAYNNYTTSKPDINISEVSSYILYNSPPKPEKIAASYKNPKDKSGLKITLYQFMTCPFCCKVRAFLDYHGFSYDVVEVNSVTRKETKWTKYRKVPMLVINEESSGTVYQLKDSTLIMSALASYMVNNSKLKDILEFYPISNYVDETDKKKKEKIINKYSIMYEKFPTNRTKEEIANEIKWRRWVDEHYVHMLSPNVYRTFTESRQAFSWFEEAGNWKELFPTWERMMVHYVGATAMYFIGKRLKKRHNLTEDVRSDLYESSNIWLKAIKKKNTKFMGGDKANLSDISVYGVLTAIEGCDTFVDLMQNTKIKSWFEDMKIATKDKLGSDGLSKIRKYI